MFVEQVLRTYITGPVVMLDLCAAPGGKSTHARSVLPVGSLLVANEVMRNRSQVLAENLIKWGNAEVVVRTKIRPISLLCKRCLMLSWRMCLVPVRGCSGRILWL